MCLKYVSFLRHRKYHNLAPRCHCTHCQVINSAGDGFTRSVLHGSRAPGLFLTTLSKFLTWPLLTSAGPRAYYYRKDGQVCSPILYLLFGIFWLMTSSVIEIVEYLAWIKIFYFILGTIWNIMWTSFRIQEDQANYLHLHTMDASCSLHSTFESNVPTVRMCHDLSLHIGHDQHVFRVKNHISRYLSNNFISIE